MKLRKAFGIICGLFFIFGGFFSILLHNKWHAIAIFGAGIAAIVLLWPTIRRMLGGPYQMS